MQIDRITIYLINLPFSLQFSHALRKRSSVKNIIVKVDAAQGKIKGYGEGAPRSFVTGETQKGAAKSVIRFVQQDHFPWDLEDISQIWNFIDSLSNKKTHNAAVCALETALLDALGKRHEMNIIDYFPDYFATNKVYYGVALPLSGKQTTMELCGRSLKMKIRKLKLKMGKDLVQNSENFEAVRMVFGEEYDLKVDVNGVWDGALALKHESLLTHYKVKVVEQPMPPNSPELSPFANLMQKAGVILMADESACSLGDVKKIVKESYYEMINVRLSKCGGFRNSLKMIDYLRRHRISFQIGCHLGESGILSAAGRILCLLCNDAVYYDGSYDEYLLEKNVTLENVSFGSGGEAKPLNGPGLGIEVGSRNLSSLSEGPPIVIERP
ncbi:MAG: dipeptide epimerase [Thermodesulfobacteriota bacterium]|nr:MAG: dipeptide epimerase [Thermodesulfobacteriota bacterium]